MKRNYFLVVALVFSLFFVKAQQVVGKRYYPPTKTMRDNQMSLKAYIDYMDEYWENTPHDFKGSGIKPYLRWKENIKSLTKSNGEILTREEIRSSWASIVQERNTNKRSQESEWIPMGPFDHTNAGSWSSGQGRVNITTVDPNNPNVLYVGTPDGGAWKSINHGESWVSLTDNLPVWGVSGIAVDPNNSNIVYISTGDEDGWNTYSDGVYKSVDGGVNWQQTNGIPQYTQLGEIYIDPSNTNVLWVCSNNGLFKSVDAGLNWTFAYWGNIKEIRLKPEESNTLYIVQNDSQNSVVNILKSIDSGVNFSTIKSYSDAGRTVIDVTNANPEVLYVLVSNANGSFKTLDKTNDSGATFTTQQNTTDVYDGSAQAYYDLAMVVSDEDENRIYTGCLNVWESSNGGLSFSQYNNWASPYASRYTHGDIHDLKMYNNNLYASTDGGIYSSIDGGVTMQNLTIGMNISQFYRIDVAQNNLSQIVGGLQDNGGYVLSNETWKNYHGADGMDNAINPMNPQQHFGFIQYGYYLYAYDEELSNEGFPVAFTPEANHSGWIVPLEMGNQGTLYAGYSKVYKLSSLNEWEEASNHNFWNGVGGIRVAPDDDNLVLVSDGDVLYQSDGASPMNFSPIINSPILCFDYNRNESNIIYACSYTSVLKSTDSGQSWEDISQGLPQDVYKVGIIHQASSINNTLYLATRNAVYYRNDDSTEWQLYSDGLPHSKITDIEVNNIENSVIISTYGRGIWRAPVDSESLSVQDFSKNKDEILFYPNPAIDEIKLNVSIQEKSKIEFYNVEGELVKAVKVNSVDKDTVFNVSDLVKGVYIVKLTSPRHLITKKIIKK